MDDPAPKTPVKRPRRGWIALLAVVLLGSAAAVSFGSWIGPSALLRFAVRTFDPALRLKVGSFGLHNGEVVLRGIEIHLRGRKEPIFKAGEIVAGLGPHWRKGKIGSLVLTGPLVSLDRQAIDHFATLQSGGGRSLPWDLGRLEIRRGHVWIEGLGQSAMDISVNVDGALEQVGSSVSGEMHTLQLSNMYAAAKDGQQSLPVLGAGSAELKFNFAALQQGKVSGLRVEEGWMIAGVGLQRLIAGGGETVAGEPGPTAVIESLDLVKMQVQPDGLPGGLPEIRLSVTSALRNVALGSVAGELGETAHQVEFGDVELLSPTDPLRRALTIRSVFVKFTLAGLARRNLDELILLGPTIYVGEPLFEYMQSADAQGKPPEPAKEDDGWNVAEMKANFGRLVVAVGGRQSVGLPLAFYTTARNVSLSSLAGLNLELVLKVPEEDYEFPAYDLSLGGVRGDLRLNYPPDILRNNLVNVVRFDTARWRNFRARDLWVSVTFDLEGINGLFGGEAYGGYVSGGFSFFLQPDAPWTGWLSATKLDLDRLTQDGAPHHFTMSGLADAKVEINGSATRIERVSGSLRGRGKGRMVINKLNDMLAAIPPEWWSLKRELSRVTLKTLRDYDYDAARADFWFVADRGRADLRMRGPAGSRNIDLVLHGDGTSPGVWSQ